MGKGALRPFFKGHSLKKEKEHEKKEVDKMLSHFVTLPFFILKGAVQKMIPIFCTALFSTLIKVGPGRIWRRNQYR